MDKDQIKAMIVQSAETLMSLPNIRTGSAMSGMDSLWKQVMSEYPPERTRYRSRATPAEIDDMYKVWEWINTLESESDRKLLYAWGYIKARKGAKLKGFAAKNCMSEGGLRKKIDKLCQLIANNQSQLLNNWKQ